MEQNPQKNLNSAENAEAIAALLKQINRQNIRPAGVRENDLQQIDLIDMLWYILARVKYVVIAAILGALLGGLYGQSSFSASYSATAKLYLTNFGTSISISELQLGTLMSADYQEIFKTWEIHEMVRSQLDLSYSYEQLAGMVSVNNPTGTRVLYITVRNSDAQMAANLANAYADATREFILKSMDGREPSVFSAALVPSRSLGENVSRYLVMGFGAGAAIPLMLICLLYIMDDRPTTTEDIEKASGLSVLAVIPSTRIRSAKSRKGRAKK